MKLSHRMTLVGAATFALAALFSIPSARAEPTKIPIRVVIVTTFELGEDRGDTPGEFQYWVKRLPLKDVIPFEVGNRPLRYNAQKQVLGIVTGSGSINSAASIMALGLDSRFDLSHAYWILNGIAGINPNVGSVGSAAWAEWVVDRDLVHEIDAREIPAGWSTGIVPLARSRPFEGPPPPKGIFSPSVYHLNSRLVDWAYVLTADTKLADTQELQTIRTGYPDRPEAMKPPHVIKGDEVSANDWWLGTLMNDSAEQWMRYWTDDKGVSATTAMEDCGALRSLQMLAQAHRVDTDRVLVLRTASNFTVPAKGESAAELLAGESSSDSATHLSAFIPALEAGYRVGSKVADTLSANWARFADHPPGSSP